MKTSFRISVKKPCSQNFNNFNKTKDGGFCSSCEKEVIDFTQMTQKDLVDHFLMSNTKTCGRFKASQLNTNLIPAKGRNNFLPTGVGILSFSLLALCNPSNLQSQEQNTNNPKEPVELANHEKSESLNILKQENYTIKGIVLDDQNQPLPGTNVVLKRTDIGVVTDFDGKFKFSEPLKIGDTLIFSYLGFDQKEYVVTKKPTNIVDVTITFDATDIILMGDVAVEGVYSSKKNIFQKLFGL